MPSGPGFTSSSPRCTAPEHHASPGHHHAPRPHRSTYRIMLAAPAGNGRRSRTIARASRSALARLLAPCGVARSGRRWTRGRPKSRRSRLRHGLIPRGRAWLCNLYRITIESSRCCIKGAPQCLHATCRRISGHGHAAAPSRLARRPSLNQPPPGTQASPRVPSSRPSSLPAGDAVMRARKHGDGDGSDEPERA
jgi:hypothetical protein